MSLLDFSAGYVYLKNLVSNQSDIKRGHSKRENKIIIISP